MPRWILRNVPVLVFLGLFLVGFVLHYMPESWLLWSWLYSASRPLSDALMVAGILGLTVDSFLKRALIRDVGSIFIGWALPQEIRSYIRDVSQSAIVRRNHKVNVKLSIDGDSVVVDVSEHFDLFNFSTGFKRYQTSLALDLFEQPDQTATRCECTYRGKTVSYTIADDVSPAPIKRRRRDKLEIKRGPYVATWTAPKKFVLCPQDFTDPGIQPLCQVRWQYRHKLPKHYSIIFGYVHPTIGVSVTLDCPETIECDCDQAESRNHADGSNYWSYDRLFMPGQTLRVRWKPRQ